MGWLTGPQTVAKQGTDVILSDRPNRMMLDAFGPRNPNNAGIIEQDGSYTNYAVNGYGRNELVYACIRYRAESVPQAVIRVWPEGNALPLNNHRLRLLFEDPNPITDEQELFELSVTYKDLAGTCFWLVVKGRDGLPSQLWPLRPDLVGVLPNPRDPADFVWIYRPDPLRPEIMVPVENASSPRAKLADMFMLRIRYPNPNPLDPGWRYFGQPPLRAAARATTMDNAATDFADGLLRNHAMPSVLIETEAEINDTLQKRLSARWREAFGGSNRGAPAFLQKGMKVHTLGMTLQQLEFPDLRTFSETRICGAFGVEPILVGTKIGLEHNAYKDYREARLSFWEESMFTEQRRFIAPVRKSLLPLFTGVGRARIRVGWDNSEVLALREANQALWDRGVNALARGGITRNDFRAMVGLPSVEGGDVFLTPAGVVPTEVGQDPAAAVETASASYGMLAAEFGLELTDVELRALTAREEGWADAS